MTGEAADRVSHAERVPHLNSDARDVMIVRVGRVAKAGRAVRSERTAAGRVGMTVANPAHQNSRCPKSPP